MNERHKVFISFHHGDPLIDPNCGQKWKERFEKLFHDKYESLISYSVQDGDINDGSLTETTRQKIRDEYIAGATVTVVLVGPETWKRKHVDWEISSSIRDTKNNSRCGLLGILLPTYPDYDKLKNEYNPFTIPPRLYDNTINGYAKIYIWDENPDIMEARIHETFERRKLIEPKNSFPMFSNNRPADQKQWQY